MTFNKYKDGAWMEPESGVKRYSDGAWTDCKSAKRYKDGAWTIVWEDIKNMTEGMFDSHHYNNGNRLCDDGNNFGILTVSSDGSTLNFLKFQDDTTGIGTVEGGGYLGLYVDGSFTKPTISFDWSGGFVYRIRTMEDPEPNTWYRVPAGEIHIQYRRGDGVYNSISAVGQVGSTTTGTSVGDESGSYSTTITFDGEITGLGFYIYIAGYLGEFFNAALSMTISNFKINGKAVKFPKSIEFENQDWG